MERQERSRFDRILIFLNRYHIVFVILVVLGFLISGTATLHLFGISWDEGLGDFFFGERYFYYFTTLQEKYLDFSRDPKELSQLPLPLFDSPQRDSPHHFPPVANTLSAATMHLFAYRLGWMDPVDAFHFFEVFLASAFLLIFYIFFHKRIGKLAAFLAVLLLAVFPRFWGDMHFNPKDVPVTIFIAFTIMAYLSWYDRPNIKKAFMVGILFASAMGIKANAAFAPLICLVGIWRWPVNKNALKENLDHISKYFTHYLIMGIVFLVFYYAAWPYLYENPSRIMLYFQYITSQGGRTGMQGWSWDPILQVIGTMPEGMLFFLLTGLFFSIQQLKRKDDPTLRLLLAWFAIPIIRISLPGMVNFNGIRHYLEFLPAAALISGYGIRSLIKAFGKQSSQRKMLAGTAVVLLIALNTLWINNRFYPYQYIYYNSLVGGLSGAERIYGIDEVTDYWAVSYRDGMRWMNSHTSGDVNLYVPYTDWLVWLPRHLWLRPGIQVIKEDEAARKLDAGETFYVFLVYEPPYHRRIANYCAENLEPVYEIKVDNAPIFYIFKVNG